MKTRTVYESVDGVLFKSEAECLARDAEYGEAMDIVEKLPKESPEGSRYIQCDAEMLRSVKRELFSLLAEKYGEIFPIWREWTEGDVHPLSHVGRIIDDIGGPLAKAWRMLAVYDFSTGRKYSQPYFALHPKESESVDYSREIEKNNR